MKDLDEPRRSRIFQGQGVAGRLISQSNIKRKQFLKNPGKYKSVSAFAPIANPSNCPWGQKAFTGYFGAENKQKWADHDATELVKNWKGDPLDILIDVVRFPPPPPTFSPSKVFDFLLSTLSLG